MITGYHQSTVRLRRRESLHGWLPLRDSLAGIAGTGEFRLRIVWESLYLQEAGGPSHPFTIESNQVTFRVLPAAGEDAKAVKLIEARADKNLLPPVEKPGDPPTDSSERDILYEQYRLDRWYHPDWGVLPEILKTTKSSRFTAAARFWKGYIVLARSARTTADGWDYEELRAAAEQFERCFSSPGSSHYLKGLAAYHLLFCKRHSKDPGDHQEARQLAESLLKEYPGTALAQDAQRLLDDWRPPRK
jgi:hypothetical protein